MVDRIIAQELADRIDGDGADGRDAAGDGASFTIVDTRQADSFEGWHIDGAVNVPFDPTEGFEDAHHEAVEDAAGGDPVVVICGKGLTSTPFGLHLADDGYDDVTVVRGGMEAWSTVHEVVEITDGREEDELVVLQLQRRATGCLGYVVGSRRSGEAVVIDPTRQIDEYVVAAEEAGLEIVGVLDTHVHADHVSGGPELAERLDVPYRLGIGLEDPTVEHGYESLADRETLALGNVELAAVHTPGHTEEMVNVVVDDTYLLTSDTLHVDSVGRTELGFGEDGAEQGAELLHDSIHDRLLELDDDLDLLPGHVSVTEDNRFESATVGEPVEATLGVVREAVDLVGLDEDAFVAELVEDLPEKPDQYETVIAINAGEESVETEEDAAELETGPNSCSA